MSNSGQNRVLNNIVSPYGLAIISYAFFLFSCLIPPSVYTHYMNEPDLMFLDPATILFYTLCVASFIAGVWLVSWLLPTTFVDRKIETSISPTVFLMIPLTVGIVVTAAALFLLIEHNPEFLVLLATQQGGELKEAIALQVPSVLNLAPTTLPLMLTGIVWWAFWRSSDLQLSGWRDRLVKFALLVAVVSVIAAATLFLSRGILMMVTCGLAILYVLRRTAGKPISFRFVLGLGAAVAVCVALLFFAFSFLRGVASWDDQITILMGYTAASYNRLAAIVNGDLRYPFAGRGLYLSSFIASNHTLNRFVPLGTLMNWPDQLEVWGAEFGAVTRAGLDGTLIWSGAFGYIFSDLGWFSFPFVFGCGLLYGVAWRWIKRGAVLGFVLYPYFGFCALLWLSTNGLLDSQLAVMSVVAIFLTGYESVFVKSEKTGVPA